MIQYIRRLIKILIYALFIIGVILVIIPVLTGNTSISETFQELIGQRRFIIIMLLFAVYSLLYPVIGFTKMKRYINGSFDENRTFFEGAFNALDYIKIMESGQEIVYRKRSKLTRALQLWEDEVILDTSDNPVIISGMRKAVIRINRRLEQSLLKEDQV